MTESWTELSGMTGNEPVPLDSRAPREMELTQVGRYRLCFELASGGMATVYLARMDGPHGFEKLVALKRVHPHLVSDRRYVEMFLDEARIASGITHANVCSVFDFGESGGEYYLAMEYLVGEPLARLFRRASASAEQRESPLLTLKMARIIEEACEGLHAAHESRDASGQPLNVVHRDVSPRNLFITYSGVVQVVDFGIASARQRVHRTATGQLKGTMPYMAPEQVTGAGADRRLDIWSLGVVLWELLTLERLFRRETEAETMYAVLVGDIPLPSDRRADIPPELDTIVMKALERDPAKRWQTAREMGQALRAFASKQSAVVGAAELSNWMEGLFPQGEAQKREIMELALTQGFQALQPPQDLDAELTGALTVTAAIQPDAVSTTRPTWKRLGLAIALGVFLVSVAVVWGFQELGPNAPHRPRSRRGWCRLRSRQLSLNPRSRFHRSRPAPRDWRPTFLQMSRHPRQSSRRRSSPPQSNPSRSRPRPLCKKQPRKEHAIERSRASQRSQNQLPQGSQDTLRLSPRATPSRSMRAASCSERRPPCSRYRQERTS